MGLGEIISQAWEDVMRTHEDPLSCGVLGRMFGFDRRTYRDRLDAYKINYFGERIPRIEIVRQNLAAFKAGNTMMWRGLNVKDRREIAERRSSSERGKSKNNT